MQEGPVIIREDVTVSLDKDLINELLGIAESREVTLSVLVREVLGSFCRSFRSGTDWTRDDTVQTASHSDIVGSGTGSQDSVSLLQVRINAHDSLLADLQRRITVLESGAGSGIQSLIFPSHDQPVQSTLISPQAGQLAAVIDCEEPLAGSVSDEALVRVRKPVPPVMTSVDINSIGRINPQQVYSQTEAAALLNISTSTIRKYVKEERIGFQKIGRSTLFRGQDLLTFLARI